MKMLKNPTNKRIILSIAIFCHLSQVAVAGGIIVDKAGNEIEPIVVNTGTGVPMVQIATPSKAGVSRNTFAEYNVDDRGLVLNNSQAVVRTQIGGYVDANPQLGRDSARIILNEVTGSSLSSMTGYTEVAGPNTEVIVANPNGISCDGCGFINTTDVTLTTGKPEFKAGAISGYAIDSGAITFAGQGLNATNVDILQVSGKTVTIDAPLNTHALSVIAGNNRVGVDGTVTSSSASAHNGGAIDVTALGGAYADTIYLKSTSDGIGVNVAGTAVSNVGNFIIDSAGNVVVDGTVQSNSALDLETQGDLNVAGTMLSTQDNTSNVVGASDVSGQVLTHGNLNLRSGTLNVAGDLLAAKTTTLRVNDSTIVSGSVGAGTNLSLQSDQLTITQSGTVQSDANAEISIDSQANIAGVLNSGGSQRLQSNALDISGQVNSTNGLTLAVDEQITVSGQISAQSDLTLSAQSLSLSGGIDVDGDNQMAIEETLTTDKDSVWRVLGELSLDAVTFSHAGLAVSASDLNVTASNTTVDGELSAVGQFTADLAQLNIGDVGRVVSNQDMSLAVANSVTNRGEIAALQTVEITAQNIDNQASGLLISGADTSMTVAHTLTNQGVLQIDGDLAISAADIEQQGSVVVGEDAALDASGAIIATKNSRFNSDQGVTLNADGIDIAGRWVSGDDFSATANSIDISGELFVGYRNDGSENPEADLALTTAENGALALSGTIASAGSMQLQSTVLDIQDAHLQAGTDLNLATSGFHDNTQTQLLAGQNLAVTISGLADTAIQHSAAANDAYYTAAKLTLDQAQVVAEQALTIDSTDLTIKTSGLQGDVVIATAQNITEDDSVVIARTTQLTAEQAALGGQWQADQSIEIITDTLVVDTAELTTLSEDGAIALNASSQLSSDNSLIDTANLSADTLVFKQNGDQWRAEQLEVTGNIIEQQSSKWHATDVSVQSSSVAAANSTWVAADTITVVANDISLDHSALQSARLDVTGQSWAQAGQLDLADNQQAGINTQELNLDVSAVAVLDDAQILAQQANVSADTLSITDSTVAVDQQLNVGARGDTVAVDIQHSALLAGTNITLQDIASAGIDQSRVQASELRLDTTAAGNVSLTGSEMIATQSLAVTGGNALTVERSQLIACDRASNPNCADTQTGAVLSLDMVSQRLNDNQIHSSDTLLIQGQDISSNSQITANQRLDIDAATLNADNAVLDASVNLTINASTALSAQSATLQAGNDIKLNQSTGTAALQNASLLAGHDIDIRSNAINAKSAVLVAENDIITGQTQIARVADGSHNAVGQWQAGNNIELRANSDLRLAADEQLVATHLQVDLNGQSLHNAGLLLGQNSLIITQQNHLNNSGQIASKADLALSGTGDLSNSGTLQAANDVTLEFSKANNTGMVQAVNNLSLTADQLNNSGTLSAGADIDVTATGAVTTDGELYAAENVNLTAQTLSASGIVAAGVVNGHAVADGSIAASVSGVANVTEQWVAGTDISIEAATLNLTDSAQISAGQNASLRASESLSQAGASVLALNDISVHAASLDTQNADIKAGRDLAVDALSLSNTGGLLQGGQSLILSTQSLSEGSYQAGSDMTLNLGESYTHTSAHTLQSNGDLTLNVEGSISNTDTLGAVETLTINATALRNQLNANIIASTVNANLTGTLTNDGAIEGDTLALNASDMSNTGDVIGDNLTLKLSGDYEQTGSAALLAASEDLNIHLGGTLKNEHDALIFSLGDMVIAGYDDGELATEVLNDSATIESEGSLSIAASSIENRRDLPTLIEKSFTIDAVKGEKIDPLPSPYIRGTRDYVATETYQVILDEENQGQLLAGEQMTLVAESIVNEYSTIATAGTLTIGDSVAPSLLTENQSSNVTDVPDDFESTSSEERLPEPVDEGEPEAFALSMLGISETDGPEYSGLINNYVGQPATDVDWEAVVAEAIAAQEAYAATLPEGETFAIGVNIQGESLEDDLASQGSGTDAATEAPTTTDPNEQTATIDGVGTTTVGGTSVTNTALITEGVRQKAGTDYLVYRASRCRHGIKFFGSCVLGREYYDATSRRAYNPVETFEATSVSAIISGDQIIAPTLRELSNSNYAAQSLDDLGELMQVTAPAPAAEAVSATDSLTLQDVDPNTNAIEDTAAPEANQSQPDRAVAAVEAPHQIDQNEVDAAQIKAQKAVAAAMADPNSAPFASGLQTQSLTQLSLPNNGLFILNDAPQHDYLIETHDRFAQSTAFLGSDYMMQSISPDTDQHTKRLGDAFYEAQLVADQIQDVSGDQYLSRFNDKGDQFQWLMDNAIAAANTLPLSAGVALSGDYLAQLTKPIVWPVDQRVTLADGSVQTVSVPVVYLPALSYNNLKNDGAIIVGNTTQINSSGNINNLGGTISGRQQLALQSGANITNVAGTLGGGDISIDAAGSIKNLATTRDFSFKNAAGSINQTVLTGQGTLQGSGKSRVNAGADFIDQAGRVLAGGNLNITAGGSVQQLDLALRSAQDSADTQSSGKATATSTLLSGGDASLSAGADITSVGANLQSGGKLSLVGVSVNLAATEESQTQTTELNGGLLSYQNNNSSTNQSGVTANAAGGIQIEATKTDITLTGTALQSTSDIALKAESDVNLIEARDTSSELGSVEKSGGLFQGDSSSSSKTDKNLADISTLEAGGTINIEAKGDILSQATTFTADGKTTLAADGDVTLTSAKNSETTETSESSSSWGSLISEDSSERTDSLTHSATVINAQAIEISGSTVTLEGSGLNAQSVALAYEDLVLSTLKNTTSTSVENDSSGILIRTIGNGGSISEDAILAQINAEQVTLNGTALIEQSLSSESLLEEIKANNPDLNTEQIETIQAALENDQWYDQTKSLSKLGSVLVQAAVSYFTAGAGVGLFNPSNSLMNAMVDQAVGSMIKQATTELATAAITGEALNLDMDSMFKSALQSAALAGATTSIDTKMGFDQIAPDAMTLAQQAQQTVLHSAAQGAVYQTDFAETLKSSALSQTADTAFEFVGHELYENDAYADIASSLPPKTVTHAMIGGVFAELGGGDFSSGAIGTAVGHVVGEFLKKDELESFDPSNPPFDPSDPEALAAYASNIESRLVAIGEVVGAAAAILTTEDITGEELAQVTMLSSSVVENNVVCGGMCIAGAIGALITIYDAYSTYQDEGTAGLARQLLIDGVITAVGGGVFKIGGKVFTKLGDTVDFYQLSQAVTKRFDDLLPWQNKLTAEDFRAYDEGKWINPETGKIEEITDEVIKRWGKIEKDHIFPIKAIEYLPGFKDLNYTDQLKILNDYDNLQPLPKRLNASKSNCTQFECDGSSARGEWTGHSKMDGLNEDYAKALMEYQKTMREELTDKIKELNTQ